MIKKTLSYLTLAIAFAGLSSSAFAGCNNGQCNDNNDSCCDDSKFDLSLHALIAKPCQNVGYVAISDEATADNLHRTSTTYFHDYDWDWGVAAAASFKMCDEWSLGARYSYIQADTGTDVKTGTASVSNSIILRHGFPSGTISASLPTDTTILADEEYRLSSKLETEMHTLDLLAQYDCCLCGNFKFKPFGGIRMLKIENEMTQLINEDVAVASGNATGQFNGGVDGVYYNQEFTAYGVVAGFDWEWGLCGDFYLIGSLSGAAMGAEEDSAWVVRQFVNAEVTNLRENTECKGVLSLDANVGFAWNTCLFGKGFDVQALYETRYLSNVANPSPVLTSDTNYGVHGFKLGVGVSF